MNVIHLETSFTLASDSKDAIIDYKTFANEHLHFIIFDAKIAANIRKIAFGDGVAIEKYYVGGATKTKVEFYKFDLKKDKKSLKKIKDVVAEVWLESIRNASTLCTDNGKKFFEDALTPSINKIEKMISLRRFLSNALSNESIKKTKLMYLLFHHTQDNAPE